MRINIDLVATEEFGLSCGFLSYCVCVLLGRSLR